MSQTTSDGATRIRVGIADDEPLLTAGLAMILSAQDDLEVLWRAERGDEALVRATEQPVDVLLLDVQMPGPDGLETTRRWVREGRPGRVVILTTFDTDGYVMGAVEAGAAGFLLKNTAPEEIARAIRTVDRGDSVISPGPTRRLLGALRQKQVVSPPATPTSVASLGQAHVPDLTDREREVLRLIALGLTNQELCDRLWLSMPTVKTHVSHLLAKTGARDRVQLVLDALRTGIVTMDEVLSEG
ncbi:response regulator [Actinomyces haliotis]|uniref:response regulator n=1 Tax=Actinomyces haliotis TaxID=1280843 RepID=UPI0018904E61|nr:response regulator transcription factor [Actinomyces haliotis]